MDENLVSIITPTYNCGRFIADTIESVLAQTYRNWEMIIADDCSTDDTLARIKPYIEADSRIRYIRNEKNSGAAITRNHALKEAKGRWIAFLDSDDLWRPEKLERQIRFMEDNDYHFSYHEYVEIDEVSKELGIYVSGIKKVGKFGMYCCCWPGCLSVMYDAKVIGLIQIPDIKKNNDMAMWLLAIRNADCHLLKENLAFYRRRTGSITNISVFQKIKWHYMLFMKMGHSAMGSLILTGCNIIGSSVKKIFYVKKQ